MRALNAGKLLAHPTRFRTCDLCLRRAALRLGVSALKSPSGQREPREVDLGIKSKSC